MTPTVLERRAIYHFLANKPVDIAVKQDGILRRREARACQKLRDRAVTTGEWNYWNARYHTTIGSV